MTAAAHPSRADDCPPAERYERWEPIRATLGRYTTGVANRRPGPRRALRRAAPRDPRPVPRPAAEEGTGAAPAAIRAGRSAAARRRAGSTRRGTGPPGARRPLALVRPSAARLRSEAAPPTCSRVRAAGLGAGAARRRARRARPVERARVVVREVFSAYAQSRPHAGAGQWRRLRMREPPAVRLERLLNAGAIRRAAGETRPI